MLLSTCLACVIFFLQTGDKAQAPTVYEQAKPALAQMNSMDASGRLRNGSGVIIRSDGIILQTIILSKT